ncbi:unnamed protein product, partial [Brassica napus]
KAILCSADTTWCCLCCGQVWRPVYRRESLRCNVRLTQLWQSRRLSVDLLSGICCMVMDGYGYPTKDAECYNIFEKNEPEQLCFWCQYYYMFFILSFARLCVSEMT